MFRVLLLQIFLITVNSSLTNKVKLESTASNVKLESLITTKPTKTVENDAFEFDPQVFSENNKILIVNNHCSVIRSFSLSQNFSFNCYDKHLQIDFILKHHTGEKILTSYLDEQNNELHNKQETTFVCRKIRR